MVVTKELTNPKETKENFKFSQHFSCSPQENKAERIVPLRRVRSSGHEIKVGPVLPIHNKLTTLTCFVGRTYGRTGS